MGHAADGPSHRRIRSCRAGKKGRKKKKGAEDQGASSKPASAAPPAAEQDQDALEQQRKVCFVTLPGALVSTDILVALRLINQHVLLRPCVPAVQAAEEKEAAIRAAREAAAADYKKATEGIAPKPVAPTLPPVKGPKKKAKPKKDPAPVRTHLALRITLPHPRVSRFTYMTKLFSALSFLALASLSLWQLDPLISNLTWIVQAEVKPALGAAATAPAGPNLNQYSAPRKYARPPPMHPKPVDLAAQEELQMRLAIEASMHTYSIEKAAASDKEVSRGEGVRG